MNYYNPTKQTTFNSAGTKSRAADHGVSFSK